MSGGELVEGKGRCLCTARLLIRPLQEVIEMGAGGDVMRTALNAVHGVNRRADRDDFLAVALPAMHKGRQGIVPGFEIEVFGTEGSLARLLQMEGMERLVRRRMVTEVDVTEAFLDVGEIGAAYVRDRRADKYSPGWIRRNQSRSERRGKAFEFEAPAKRHDGLAVCLHYGRAAVNVREIVSSVADAPLLVSTYGFSSAGTMAVLPVLPESARRKLRDAA